MNEPLPTLKQLRYLVALADHRHFGKAAEACFVTQSTLSASLKELEDDPAGAAGGPHQAPGGAYAAGRGDGRARPPAAGGGAGAGPGAPGDAGAASGTVRLGVIPTIGPFLLPRILPALRAAYPKLKLYLREDQTDAAAGAAPCRPARCCC